MKRPRVLWIALLLLVTAAPIVYRYGVVRSVAPVLNFASLDVRFDPAASAGVFVGVQQYRDATLSQVQFAADDAVDLAHIVVLQRAIIPATRAIVAIAGKPRKTESILRLQELRNAGVTITGANHDEVLEHVKHQAIAAGSRGLLIVSFAGHGFSKSGTPYLATSTALLNDSTTWLSSSELLDVAAQHASRSLVFIDACRERVAADGRSVAPSPLSMAALIPRMTKVHGQVAFYAAPAGGYAYDDLVRKNGVFTAAVIEGLQCGTRPSVLTVDKLEKLVAARVGAWVRANKDPRAKSVMQTSIDDRARKMPLVTCGNPGPPRPEDPAQAEVDGTKIHLTNKTGVHLRTIDAGAPLTQAEVADLDGDKRNEVVAAVGDAMLIYEGDGRPRKRVAIGQRVTKFAIEKLFWANVTKQIVLIANDTKRSASQLIILDRVGLPVAKRRFTGELHDLLLSENKSGARLQNIILTAFERGRAVVILVDPKKPGERWRAAARFVGKIRDIVIGDHDRNDAFDLEIRTTTGKTAYLDFEGRSLPGKGPALFDVVAPK